MSRSIQHLLDDDDEPSAEGTLVDGVILEDVPLLGDGLLLGDCVLLGDGLLPKSDVVLAGFLLGGSVLIGDGVFL